MTSRMHCFIDLYIGVAFVGPVGIPMIPPKMRAAIRVDDLRLFASTELTTLVVNSVADTSVAPYVPNCFEMP